MRDGVKFKTAAAALLAGAVAALSGCAAGPGPLVPQPVVTTTPDPLASVAVGNCIAGIPKDASEAVTVVACGQKHHWEVSAVLAAAGDSYPGEEALRQRAQQECGAALAAYLGVDAAYSPYRAGFLAPNAAHWDNADNRKIACLVGSAEVSITASLAKQAVVYPVKGQCATRPASDSFGVKLLACDKPHYYEVYASKKWSGKTAPTAAEFDKLYKSICVDGFKEFVGLDVGKSKYEILHFMVPASLWTKLPDHRLVCSVGSPTGKITGTLAKAKT